jgi:hypothetical protein
MPMVKATNSAEAPLLRPNKAMNPILDLAVKSAPSSQNPGMIRIIQEAEIVLWVYACSYSCILNTQLIRSGWNVGDQRQDYG